MSADGVLRVVVEGRPSRRNTAKGPGNDHTEGRGPQEQYRRGVRPRTASYTVDPAAGIRRLPANMDQSCFLDSIVGALFIFPCDFIRSHVLNAVLVQTGPRGGLFGPGSPQEDLQVRQSIQSNLVDLATCMRTGGTGSPEVLVQELRRLLNTALLLTPALTASRCQQDAGEYLYALFEVFGLNDGPCKMDRSIFFTNDLLASVGRVIHDGAARRTTYADRCGTIVHLPAGPGDDGTGDDFLVQTTDSVLQEPYVHSEDGASYCRVVTRTTWTPNEFFVVHVDRSVVPHRTVRLDPYGKYRAPDGRNFRLASAVLRTGDRPDRGHFVCVVRRGVDSWLVYDDLTPDGARVEPFGAVRERVQEQAMLLFFFFSWTDRSPTSAALAP